MEENNVLPVQGTCMFGVLSEIPILLFVLSLLFSLLLICLFLW